MKKNKNMDMYKNGYEPILKRKYSNYYIYKDEIDFEIPSTKILNKNDIEKILETVSIERICKNAFLYIPSVYDQYTFRHLKYFKDYTEMVLETVEDNSVIIAPGCSPSKIIWLITNLYAEKEGYYRTVNGVTKKLNIITFPISNLYTSSHLNNAKGSSSLNEKEQDKITKYLEPFFEKFKDDIESDTKIYFLDAMVSKRSFNVIMDSIANIKYISDKIKNIKESILIYNIAPPYINNEENHLMIRSFCGSDEDRIICKYNVFENKFDYIDYKNGNLSLMMYYLATTGKINLEKDLPFVLSDKPIFRKGGLYRIYNRYHKQIWNTLVKILKVWESCIECYFFDNFKGFYTGFLNVGNIVKTEEFENNEKNENNANNSNNANDTEYLEQFKDKIAVFTKDHTYKIIIESTPDEKPKYKKISWSGYNRTPFDVIIKADLLEFAKCIGFCIEN